MLRRDALFMLVLAAVILAIASAVLPAWRQVEQREITPIAWDRDLRASIDAVNQAIRTSWDTAGTSVADVAEDLTIARRISLALTGTIPSLEEIRLLESIPHEQRIRWWTDYVLDDRRWADYVAERLARVYLGTQPGPFLVHRRRRFVTWLADQLYASVPYDAMVRQMIGGEGLWTDNPATNFVTVAYDPDNERFDQAQLATSVTRSFLAVRLDCAQCHDHPFARWKQHDFEGLAAHFAHTTLTLRGIHDVEKTGTTDESDDLPAESDYAAFAPQAPFDLDFEPTEGTPRERLAQWVTHTENRAFARAIVNWTWAQLLGRPIVDPVDSIPLDNTEQEGELPPVLEVLSVDFAAHGFSLQRLIRSIIASEAFCRSSRGGDGNGQEQQSDEVEGESEAVDELPPPVDFAVFPVTHLRAEQVAGSILQASSLKTINHNSHILVRFARAIGQNEFVERYGDTDQEGLHDAAETIPQRLLLMNGRLVKERSERGLNIAASQLAELAPDDETAVEVAYLTVLTRRPTPEEAEHFIARLAAKDGPSRHERLEDIYWSLFNTAEFSWNH